MDDLVVDGEKYISSKRAARLSGYAKDYIGQLCRAGKIEAKMVGRNWYIKESALKEHRKHYQGQPVIDDGLWVEGKEGAEFQGFGLTPVTAKPRLTEEHVKITYEMDDRPLIPPITTKKVVAEGEPNEKSEPATRKEPDLASSVASPDFDNQYLQEETRNDYNREYFDEVELEERHQAESTLRRKKVRRVFALRKSVVLVPLIISLLLVVLSLLEVRSIYKVGEGEVMDSRIAIRNLADDLRFIWDK